MKLSYASSVFTTGCVRTGSTTARLSCYWRRCRMNNSSCGAYDRPGRTRSCWRSCRRASWHGRLACRLCAAWMARDRDTGSTTCFTARSIMGCFKITRWTRKAATARTGRMHLHLRRSSRACRLRPLCRISCPLHPVACHLSGPRRSSVLWFNKKVRIQFAWSLRQLTQS